jgi:uncharacterized protein (DUF885 family)
MFETRRPRRWPAVMGALAAALSLFLVPTVWLRPWSIHHFYLRTLFEFLWQSPMLCSSLHLLDVRKGRLDDFSLEQRAHLKAIVARDLEVLHGYERSAMKPDEQLSYDVMDWFLKDLAANDGSFGGGPYALDQLSGLHVALPAFLTNQHPLASKSDAEAYLARMAAAGTAFDQVIDRARGDAKRGVVPPRFILRKVRSDARAFADASAEENVLVKHLREKVAALDLSAADKTDLGARAAALAEGTVRPAFRRFLALVDELDAQSSDDAGVWKLPGGEARYAAYLRNGTASDLTAAQVHSLGLDQVARIEGELRAILAARGISAPVIGVALRALAKDPAFLYPVSDDGRRQMIAAFQSIIDDIDHKTAPLFHDRPAIGVKVEAVPAFRARTAPGGQYFPPPLDNSRPGTFFANVADIGAMPKFSMRTLAYHEAIPGHHFQIVVARQQKGLPLFRQLIPFNAYSEGWALYAEQLAAESGFEADPVDRLGFLQAQLLRATRLVVDTGLHSLRWTREQAIAYMTEHTGQPESEVVIETERYAVWPGQACGYMVGLLKILELRERAKERLGARFDLRAFHDVVLESGALPMPLLERVVDAWIAAQ